MCPPGRWHSTFLDRKKRISEVQQGGWSFPWEEGIEPDAQRRGDAGMEPGTTGVCDLAPSWAEHERRPRNIREFEPPSSKVEGELGLQDPRCEM